MEREFDVIVIGAGPAGEVAAGRLAERGARRVAIVEDRLVGGECAFYACMPSKSLLRPAEALREVARVPGAAEALHGDLDVSAVLARRDEVTHHLDDSDELGWLEERRIELVRGAARFDGERRVRVGEDLLTAREAVVLATGSVPSLPPIPGLGEVAAWTNREGTTSREVPASLLLLGGGPVGVELAMAWASLGSQVTLIEAQERLLPNEEPFAGEEVRTALEVAGATVRTGEKAAAVARADGEVALRLASGETLQGERLLVAVGRRPQTAELGLEDLGLEPGAYVEVDDHMRVPHQPWLYAVGDVNGRALLTHAGKYQARVAADNILGETAVVRVDGAAMPRVTFTDPQVAAVGETLAAAQDRGAAAAAIDLPTSGTAGASFYGREAPGTTRFVVDLDRRVLLGATFVGAEVADFLQAASIAIAAGVPLASLAHAIAPFPTRSELWLRFLEEVERRLDGSLHASTGAQQDDR